MKRIQEDREQNNLCKHERDPGKGWKMLSHYSGSRTCNFHYEELTKKEEALVVSLLKA